MRRLIDLKVFFVLVTFTFFSCEKLKPESLDIPEYPDLKEVYNQQIQSLTSSMLNKEVWLDGISEARTLTMDSTQWAKELSFLKEINPNQPEYVGAFSKSIEGTKTILSLNPGEGASLKELSYDQQAGVFSIIRAIIHEDKDVYVHHREIEVFFQNGLLSKYQINGYQKIVLKDTIEFRIKGKI